MTKKELTEQVDEIVNNLDNIRVQLFRALNDNYAMLMKATQMLYALQTDLIAAKAVTNDVEST